MTAAYVVSMLYMALQGSPQYTVVRGSVKYITLLHAGDVTAGKS